MAVCGTHEDALQKTKEHLASFGGKVCAVRTDISKPEDCDAFVSAVVKELGGLDVLVNNAGITKDGLVVRMRPEDWGRRDKCEFNGDVSNVQSRFKSDV